MRIAAIESNRSVTVNRCITVIRGSLVVASLLVLSCFPSAFLAWFLPSPETCQIEFPNLTSRKDTDTQTHKCADTQTHRFIHTQTHRQTDTHLMLLCCCVLCCHVVVVAPHPMKENHTQTTVHEMSIRAHMAFSCEANALFRGCLCALSPWPNASTQAESNTTVHRLI